MGSALNVDELKAKLQKVYKAKKRDPANVGTGEDIKPPTFYIKAPKPLEQLMGCHYPGQRMVEFVGGTNAGKTTMGMFAMVEAQKGFYTTEGEYVEEGINIILVDTEKKFSKHRFTKMGGDPTKMFKVDATTLEEAYFGINQTLEVIYATDPEAKVLVVFDSLGNTPANAEAEAEADESVAMSIAAKVNNRNIRGFIAKYFSRHDICWIWINQNYAKMGPMAKGKTNKGGQGVDLASAIIIELTKIGSLQDTDSAGKIWNKGSVTRARKTKDHTQTSEISLAEINFEIYAYEIKGLEKYNIKKGAEFVGDNGRIIVTKSGKEGIQYIMTYDNTPSGDKVFDTKHVAESKEELKKILEDGKYTPVPDEEPEK